MCMRFVRAFFLLNCTQSVCIDEIASLHSLTGFFSDHYSTIIDRTFQYGTREIFGKNIRYIKH